MSYNLRTIGSFAIHKPLGLVKIEAFQYDFFVRGYYYKISPCLCHTFNYLDKDNDEVKDVFIGDSVWVPSFELKKASIQSIQYIKQKRIKDKMKNLWNTSNFVENHPHLRY